MQTGWNNLISAINSGLSGLAVHTAMVTSAAGNLANLNTAGYKSTRVSLGTLGAASQGQGAQVLGVSRDSSPGPLVSSGGESGLALQEGSNVDPAREMINLNLGQRGFEAAIKVLQTADKMMGSILDIRS
jgi:flagellar hook protein FlgE